MESPVPTFPCCRLIERGRGAADEILPTLGGRRGPEELPGEKLA